MEGQDGALSGITAENGGNVYGGNGFEKGGDGTADHIEMDIAGGACGIEAGTWNGKTVPAASCPSYEACTDDGRCFGRQTVREVYASALKEVVNMWMLKFYKAYAKDKRLKRMLAYWGKLSKTVS